MVDDEAELRALVVRALGRDGHSALEASSLATARVELARRDVDVVVLDIGLPDGSGIELCRELRRTGVDVPLLMLTARSEIAQRVESLDAGADDFLGKPFAVAELRARVRALGRRRRGAMPATVLAVGDAELDLGARRARRGAELVSLTPREWAILDALAARGARVVPREDLLDEVWGEATERAAASLEVLIARIRRKLGEALVRTVRGVGYALGGRE